MAINITIAGTPYSVPEVNEESWGAQVTNILVALANQTLNRGSGSFVLTQALSFGSNFGISVKDLSSTSGNISTSGFLKLSNTDTIGFRNSANDGNLILDLSSDKIRFGGSELVDLGSSQTLLLKVIDADENSISNIQFADNFKSGEVLSDIDDTHSDDSTVGSAKAVKAYVDDEVSDLSTTVATNLAAQKDVTETLVGKTLTSPILNDATLSGTTVIIDSTHLEVTDDLITINKDGNDASSEGAGIEIERNPGTDGTFLYEDDLASKFKIGAKGSEVEVADVSSTQTFTNKTHTAPILNDPELNDGVVKDKLILDSVSSDPTTPTSANEVVIYNKDGALTQLGTNGVAQGLGGGSGGGGALNLWSDGNAETLVASNFTESGTGTFAISSTSADLINPSRSFKISSASSAFYVETPNIDIPLGYRNRLIGIQFPYRSSDGAQMILDVVDESGVNISSSPALVDSLSSSVGSAQFRYVFQVGNNDIIRLRFRATGTVAEFIWDDVIVTPDPLITLPDTTYAIPTPTAANLNEFSLKVSAVPSATPSEGSVGATGWTTSVSGNVVTVTMTGTTFSVIPNIFVKSQDNETVAQTAAASTTSFTFRVNKMFDNTATPQTVNILVIRAGSDRVTPVLTASTEQKVITYAESLEQENSFSAKINNNGTASIVSQSENFIQSATQNGTGIVNIVWVPGFFSVAPSVIGSESGAGPQIVSSDNSTTTGVTIHTFPRGSGMADINFSIAVQRQGDDYKEPLPTGTFIVHNANPLGTVIDSVLTETQLTSLEGGTWALCDGRSIAGSALATLTSVTTAPDMRGRYRAMAGVVNSLDAKVLNETLASEVKAADVALTDPGHIHEEFSYVGVGGGNGGASGSPSGLQTLTGGPNTGSATTGITISAGDETRPETYVVNSFIRID